MPRRLFAVSTERYCNRLLPIFPNLEVETNMTLKIQLNLSRRRNCKVAQSESIAQLQELADQVAVWAAEAEEVYPDRHHTPAYCFIYI